MREIKIYGEIVPFEDAWIIEAGGYCNLTHVQNQLKEANGEDIRVRINSFGGDCDTGFAIYAELRRYAKENKATVETFGEAQVASIATVIFLAGDKRVLTEHTQPFVHNAWTYTMGDSKTLARAAADLKKYNELIAEHYSNHTDLTKEEALELMDQETSITPDEALAMRFCTEVEQVLRPAALKRYVNKNEKIDMTKNPKTSSLLNRVIEFIKKETGASNKILMTAAEEEIDFYELGEDDPVEVGAKARIGGADAEGEYVMKSGETYVFTAGELTEIKEAEDDTDELEALREENAALASQLEEVLNRAEALKTENTAMASQIAKFKAAASAPPAKPKEKKKPEEKKPVVVNKASDALKKLKEIKETK